MLKYLNERIKTLTFWDMALVKWSVLFATIIIVKLFPQILSINYPILIILMIVCMARPIYKIYIKS
jgi:antibiotic biosynthesis monooxygenase (ABM) superfamily enzyme